MCAPPACAPGVRPWGLREWWVGRQKPRWCGRAPRAGRAQGAPHLALGGRKVTNKTHVSQVTRFLVTGKLRFPLLLRCTQPPCAGNSLVHEGTPRKSGSSFVRGTGLGSYRLAPRVWNNSRYSYNTLVCVHHRRAPQAFVVRNQGGVAGRPRRGARKARPTLRSVEEKSQTRHMCHR